MAFFRKYLIHLSFLSYSYLMIFDHTAQHLIYWMKNAITYPWIDYKGKVPSNHINGFAKLGYLSCLQGDCLIVFACFKMLIDSYYLFFMSSYWSIGSFDILYLHFLMARLRHLILFNSIHHFTRNLHLHNKFIKSSKLHGNTNPRKET